MPEPEPFLIFTKKLEELGLPYMVSGSIASIYYGEPRLTNDVDIILMLPSSAVERFFAAFPLDAFDCPPLEVLRLEQKRPERGHFNLIHHETGFKADVYLARNDELHRWGLDRARQVFLGSDAIRLAPPEYVIIRKLQFYREGQQEKHLRDIHRMLLALGDDWSREALLHLIDRYGLSELWHRVDSLRE